MRSVVQRVLQASVQITEHSDLVTTGAIDKGLLVLVGFGHDDLAKDAELFFDRLLKLRIFEDDSGKMNRSVADVKGGVLIVSQFTLLADLSKGNRPSFGSAASPERAVMLYDHLIQYATTKHSMVQSGRFGADMKVSLVNDGPVTIVM